MAIGCVVLLAFFAGMLTDLWWSLACCLWFGRTMHGDAASGILPGAILVLLSLWFGIVLAKRQAGKIMLGLLSGRAGRHAVAVLAGVLFALPGFGSDLLALLLLLPPMPILLGSLGNRVVSAVIRRQMAKMAGGGRIFPGAGPFPGMRPDESLRQAPKAPRTYDTTAEREAPPPPRSLP